MPLTSALQNNGEKLRFMLVWEFFFSGLMLFVGFQLNTLKKKELFDGWWKLESNGRFTFLVLRVESVLQLPLKIFSWHLNSFGFNSFVNLQKLVFIQTEVIWQFMAFLQRDLKNFEIVLNHFRNTFHSLSWLNDSIEKHVAIINTKPIFFLLLATYLLSQYKHFQLDSLIV